MKEKLFSYRLGSCMLKTRQEWEKEKRGKQAREKNFVIEYQ